MLGGDCLGVQKQHISMPDTEQVGCYAKCRALPMPAVAALGATCPIATAPTSPGQWGKDCRGGRGGGGAETFTNDSWKARVEAPTHLSGQHPTPPR